MKIALALIAVLAQDPEAGFEKLVTKDLAGWKAYPEEAGKAFKADGDAIACTGEPAGYLHTEKAYKNFTLRFDWRYARPAALTDDAKFEGNSGYLIYIKEHKVWPTSIEVQGMNRDAGSLIPIKLKAKGAFDAEAQKKALKAVGEWNAMEIAAKDGTITVKLNDALINTITEFEPREGHIGFQSEGAKIDWRNIRIKEEK